MERQDGAALKSLHGEGATGTSSTTDNALPWGMEKTEMQPSSLASLTDDKLARFVLGQQKKTKFEKEREEREARKRQADAEAAQIYSTFVASFEDEDATLGKAFVRGSGSGKQGDNSESGSSIYRLKAKDTVPFSDSSVSNTEAVSGRSGRKMTEMERMLQEMKQSDAERQQRRAQYQTSQSHEPSKRKKREIDQFLEEIKDREPRAPTSEEMGMTKGSFDDGSSDTTNLYVGNLAPTVTEETLEAEFGKYGNVYSVKIMWPRTEEERARRRNCGFVSFYQRSDADEARINLNDKEFDGQPIVVGWGKAVKIDHSARHVAASVPVMPPTGPLNHQAVAPGKPTIRVEIPTSVDARKRVDRLARYVAKDGAQFENAVRAREMADKNGHYGFLFDMESPLALYYRWKVYSLVMGDDVDTWRETPFQMTLDGPIWVPPRAEQKTLPSARRESNRSSSSTAHSRHGDHERDASRKRSKSSSRSSSRSKSRSRRSRNHRRSRSRERSSRRTRSRSRSGSRHLRRRSRSSSSSSVSDLHSRKRSRLHRDGDERSEQHQRSQSRERRHRRSQSRSRSRHHSRNNRDNDHARAKEQQQQQLLTGQQIARAREIERGRERTRLSSDDYDEFQHLLVTLTLERESVKKAMGFALDNSEAAIDIVNIIAAAFHEKDVSAVALVGYLYVTSDILHNSSAAVKNASLFRTTFQDVLPDIMEQLRVAHKAIGGRMSANAMREKVLNVLTAWESWSLFPPGYLVGLNATFLRKVEESEYRPHQPLENDGAVEEERLRKTCRQAGILSSGDAKAMLLRLQWLKEFTGPKLPTDTIVMAMNSKATLKNTSDTVEVTTTSQNPTRDTISVSTKPDAKEDVDGEPMDEDNLDGESIDGSPLDDAEDEENVDGVPLDEEIGEIAEEALNDEDGGLNGEPLDEVDDIDGEPLDDDEDEESRH